MFNADIPRNTRDKRPLLLLVAGNWWPLAARMAAAFIEHGCDVAALCPPGHPLRHVHGVRQIRTLHRLASRWSLENALRRLKPDMVVPCDDCSVAQLHELHRLRPHLRALIERSIGEPPGFEVVQSRGRLLQTARELGIRVAGASEVTSEAQAIESYARGAPTALLKMDGTSGGEGITIVRSAAEVAAAFRCMKARASLPVAIKRLLINRDPTALWSWSRWRRQCPLTLQAFVSGTPANIMVACLRGEILAELSVQALSSQGPTGASLVVQVIENRQLSRAAHLLAKRLGISGFFGLDFILEQGTGAEYLIEMNPRCTQLGHLKLPQGDLAGALCAALLTRERLRPKRPILDDTIAFFPQALRWDVRTAFVEGVHHDVPWEQRRLMKALLLDPWPERQWTARLYHLFRRPQILRAMDTAICRPDEELLARAPAERVSPDRRAASLT